MNHPKYNELLEEHHKLQILIGMPNETKTSSYRQIYYYIIDVFEKILHEFHRLKQIKGNEEKTLSESSKKLIQNLYDFVYFYEIEALKTNNDFLIFDKTKFEKYGMNLINNDEVTIFSIIDKFYKLQKILSLENNTQFNQWFSTKDIGSNKESNSKIKEILKNIKFYYERILDKENNKKTHYDFFKRKFNVDDFSFPRAKEFYKKIRSMREYQSTNEELQYIINGKDNKAVEEFDKLFENIYKKYIEYEEKNKSKYFETEINNELLNTGINIKNLNTSNEVLEIHVLADFIEGEVNDENVNDIYCPYSSEMLGNQLDYYIENNWNEDKSLLFNNDRFLFSVKSMNSTKSINNKDDAKEDKYEEDRYFRNNDNQDNIDAYNRRREILEERKQEENEKISELKKKIHSDFLDKVLANNSEYTKKINDYSSSMMNENFDILDDLFKNSDFLYIIKKLYSENEKKNYTDFLLNFEKIKQKYDFDLKSAKANLNNVRDENKKKILTMDIERNEINIFIIDSFINVMNNKIKKQQTNTQVGGKKSKTLKNNKNKRSKTKKNTAV